jgi:NAD(P)-dependent dehydrogenase (short-subunit alcohol dehydrogenase family)
MELGLKGKSVIITGGGSNIGFGITMGFAKEGCRIMVADLDEKQAGKAAEKAMSLGSPKAIFMKTDVTKLDQVEAMMKKANEEFGAIDVLINNVGWDIPKLFMDTDEKFWDKVIAINYRSVLNCSKTALGYMIKQNKGVIVSTGSDAGRVGEFKEAVYGGTKGAVIAFTKAIARENGKFNIRANVVCPGFTLPSFTDDVGPESAWQLSRKVYTDEVVANIAKGYPLRRVGKSEDISNAMVFMASDASSFITGQTLSVSGGYSMM